MLLDLSSSMDVERVLENSWSDEQSLFVIFKGPGWQPGKPRTGLIKDIPDVRFYEMITNIYVAHRNIPGYWLLKTAGMIFPTDYWEVIAEKYWPGIVLLLHTILERNALRWVFFQRLYKYIQFENRQGGCSI